MRRDLPGGLAARERPVARARRLLSAIAAVLTWGLEAVGRPAALVSGTLVLIAQILLGFEAGTLEGAALERRGWRLRRHGRRPQPRSNASAASSTSWLPAQPADAAPARRPIFGPMATGPHLRARRDGMHRSGRASRVASAHRLRSESLAGHAARRHHRLRLGQSPLRGQGLRARGARKRGGRADPASRRIPTIVAGGRPHRAAGRRRLRRLQARSRGRARHARRRSRARCARKAGRFSASASACS